MNVNLRSVGRKRFAHLSENLDEIHVDANIPWGEDTLFTLEFRVDDGGKYALHTCNNKYLSREGKLVDECNPNCLYSAEYHSGQLALRDISGAYLSPIGSKAVLKSRSNSVTKDELFTLEDSLPQASFVAALNSRYVSVKQGVSLMNIASKFLIVQSVSEKDDGFVYCCGGDETTCVTRFTNIHTSGDRRHFLSVPV
ncbi:Fascin [Homalodisca vitripennis]|nr:Fascin [Homalodisca vitripennis]